MTNKKRKNRVYKPWATSVGKVNIGSGWTLLSLECYLSPSCTNCIYRFYCRRNLYKDTNSPIIKIVVKELLIKFGEPPQELINKLNDIYEQK